MSAVLRLPAYLGVGLVYAYRYTLGALFPGGCKYHPSCSQYAIDALRQHGLVSGVDPRRLAAPALQPVESRRRRLRAPAEALPSDPLILGSPLTPLEDLLRNVLEWFHGTIGLPWAWSIVALTICVRLLMVPLAVKQIHSMQAMQAHMPEMKAIQQRYKNDKQKRNEELMKFYRDNNVNPAAPCLPLLVPVPRLHRALLVLRQFSKNFQPGGDLSWLGTSSRTSPTHANAHWSGYLLLAIYVASQLASTYFMSTTMDRTQRTMMMVLPVAFVPVLVNFPVGLVLYWVTTNLWTVGQGLVTRRLVPKKAPPPPKRSSRTPPKERAESQDGAEPEAVAEQAGALRRQPQARQAEEEEGEALMEDLRQVEATGETVGEAKWAALRELEKLHPGLDKSRGSLPGRLRRRARAARRRLRARPRRCVGRRRSRERCRSRRRTATASSAARCASSSSGSRRARRPLPDRHRRGRRGARRLRAPARTSVS